MTENTKISDMELRSPGRVGDDLGKVRWGKWIICELLSDQLLISIELYLINQFTAIWVKYPATFYTKKIVESIEKW